MTKLTLDSLKSRSNRSVTKSPTKSKHSNPTTKSKDTKTTAEALVKKKASGRKPIRAKKRFVVIAYDVASDKRRRKVVKILEEVGNRINFSVFECMLSDLQFKRVIKEISSVIDQEEDRVVYYPICLKCFSKTIYQLPQLPHFEVVKAV